MAGETYVTLRGNLTSDPQTRPTSNGKMFVTYSVAVTPQTWDSRSNSYRDGTTSFYNVAQFSGVDTTVASLHRGDRVIVFGRQEVESYEARDGSRKTSIKVVADEVALSTRFAQVTATRARNGGSRPADSAPAATQSTSDPFAVDNSSAPTDPFAADAGAASGW